MLIQKIELCNFRQYFDKNTIEFSCDPNKNVTIVRGENGVGKTAMLNGLKWAFFDTFTSNFRTKNELINHTAKANGKTTCYVDVTFEEKGRRFLLRRIFDSKRSSKSELKLFEYDGATLGPALPEPDMVINSMLPKEMGEYFFFQGEGSNAVTTGNTSGNIAQAIRDIMGFRVATALSDSLKKILRATAKEKADQDTSGEASRINRLINNVEDEIETLTKNITEATNRLPTLQDQLKEVEEALDKIKNTNLSELRSREIKANQTLKAKRIELAELRKQKAELIFKYGWAVFGFDFASKSLDFIDEEELKGRLPEPYNKTFIDDILSKKECICGACLPEGSEGYKKIMQLLGKAANPQLQQRLSGIRAQINSIQTLYDGAHKEIGNTISQYDNCQQALEEAEQSVKYLTEQISKIPEAEIQKLQGIRNKLGDDVIQHQKNLAVWDDRLKGKDKELKGLKAELASLGGGSEVIEALSLKEAFVNELKTYLDNYMSKTEENIRFHILEKVNGTLDAFSRHNYKIKVSKDDFKFFLLDKEDRQVGQGDGLNLLLNLTITASLIQFADQRQKVKDPILSSATVAPLFIDAPFGVLDVSYRNVVVELLPDYANQVVFLVSSSQWTDEMDQVIRPRIGKEYALILEESSPQGSKPLDVLNIAGNELVVSRYGCEIDRTVIEEIA